MTALDVLTRRRRSVRKYAEGMVPMDKIQEMIAAGLWAPTACNLQGQRFVYIDDAAALENISRAGAAHFLSRCRQAILVLYDRRTDNIEYRDDILSAGAAIQNILLKASELGVGACWVCNLPAKKILRKICDVPRAYDPVSLITIGWPAGGLKEVERKRDVSEILFINKYDRARDASLTRGGGGVTLFIKTAIRFIYIRLPKTKFLRNLAGKFERRFDN
jgi:nitroreductase